MSGWSSHKGFAVALDIESVDTDQLIPARFMSTPRSEGYGQFLLHDMRYDAEGAALPEFSLNRHRNVSVLVARRNFGSGSSREAAVYALVDFGIRAVIAPSFGDIFASNAVNNGLLPARVTPDAAEAMIVRLGDQEASAEIDLRSQSLAVAGQSTPFDLDPVWREKLMNGWDDIDLTREHRAAITHFRNKHSHMRNWAFPIEETAE